MVYNLGVNLDQSEDGMRRFLFPAMMLCLMGCATNPVEDMLQYRAGYSAELLGFNVKSDENGATTAVNMEVAVENRNSQPYMSVLTLNVKIYGSANEVLDERLMPLPLEGLEGYQKKRYYPVLKNPPEGIAAISVTKAPVTDPAVYMSYREFSGLPKQ